MANAFYIYLPSDTKNPSFDNKSNKFRVILPKPLRFNSTWLCGLSSIIYPRSFASIGTSEEQFIKLYIRDPKLGDPFFSSIVVVPFQRGTYDTIESLHQHLITAFQDKVSALRREEGQGRRKRAADDTPRFYDRQPTDDEVVANQLRVATHKYRDGTSAINYYDKTGHLRFIQNIPPQYDLVHVYGARGKVHQLLARDDGLIMLKVGRNQETSTLFTTLNEPRERRRGLGVREIVYETEKFSTI